MKWPQWALRCHNGPKKKNSKFNPILNAPRRRKSHREWAYKQVSVAVCHLMAQTFRRIYIRGLFWTPPDLHCQSNQRAFSCNRGSPRLIPASVDEADVLLYLYMPYWLPFGLYLYSPSGRPSGLLSVLCTLYRASHTPFGLPYGLRTVTALWALCRHGYGSIPPSHPSYRDDSSSGTYSVPPGVFEPKESRLSG